jgi:LAO/AO transport system kinase
MWIPPVVRTVAPEDQGIDDLIAALEAHRQYLIEAKALESLERQRIEIELYDRLEAALMTRLLKAIPASTIGDIIGRVQARELDPQSAVDAVLGLQDQQG